MAFNSLHHPECNCKRDNACDGIGKRLPGQARREEIRAGDILVVEAGPDGIDVLIAQTIPTGRIQRSAETVDFVIAECLSRRRIIDQAGSPARLVDFERQQLRVGIGIHKQLDFLRRKGMVVHLKLADGAIKVLIAKINSRTEVEFRDRYIGKIAPPHSC